MDVFATRPFFLCLKPKYKTKNKTKYQRKKQRIETNKGRNKILRYFDLCCFMLNLNQNLALIL